MSNNQESSSSNVDRVYEAVKSMASSFQLKPDERINETTLARSLNTSRTPLREALNRLAAEGLLALKAGKGFYCRSLGPKEIMDLYEVRLAIERATVRLACERATDEQIAELLDYIKQVSPNYADIDEQQHAFVDEGFHIRIATMTGNVQFVRVLDNINSRIHFIRWVDMKNRFEKSYFGEHPAIANAIAKRDVDTAVATMEEHVARRSEEITAVVREGFAQLYVQSEN